MTRPMTSPKNVPERTTSFFRGARMSMHTRKTAMAMAIGGTSQTSRSGLMSGRGASKAKKKPTEAISNTNSARRTRRTIRDAGHQCKWIGGGFQCGFAAFAMSNSVISSAHYPDQHGQAENDAINRERDKAVS